MSIKVNSIEEYIEKVPRERKEAILKLRQEILDHLPEGFEETINYNMIGYVVPHSIYPKGYHCDPKLPLPFINIASQKNFIALYHLGIYAFEDILSWFKEKYDKECKYKLDMGKSCIRFKRVDDIPYDLIGELVSKVTVEKWVKHYDSIRK